MAIEMAIKVGTYYIVVLLAVAVVAAGALHTGAISTRGQFLMFGLLPLLQFLQLHTLCNQA